MSLSFLPRGVAARRALTKGNAENSTMDVDVSQPSSSTVSSSPVELRTKSQTESGLSAKKGLRWRESKWQSKKQKQRAIESRELALLLEASMSDYSLWKSQDLRRYAADKNTQGCKSVSSMLSVRLGATIMYANIPTLQPLI